MLLGKCGHAWGQALHLPSAASAAKKQLQVHLGDFVGAKLSCLACPWHAAQVAGASSQIHSTANSVQDCWLAAPCFVNLVASRDWLHQEGGSICAFSPQPAELLQPQTQHALHVKHAAGQTHVLDKDWSGAKQPATSSADGVMKVVADRITECTSLHPVHHSDPVPGKAAPFHKPFTRLPAHSRCSAACSP